MAEKKPKVRRLRAWWRSARCRRGTANSRNCWSLRPTFCGSKAAASCAAKHGKRFRNKAKPKNQRGRFPSELRLALGRVRAERKETGRAEAAGHKQVSNGQIEILEKKGDKPDNDK